jgi:hypothetical protein
VAVTRLRVTGRSQGKKSFTAKDARDAKERKSFTAKDAEEAKEKKSFSAKEIIIRKGKTKS